MLWLANVGMSNAVLATLLAFVALAVSRLTRRPALAHLLWVLVLIKLVTPPLVKVPVFVPVALRASLTRSGDVHDHASSVRQTAESAVSDPVSRTAAPAPISSLDMTAIATYGNSRVGCDVVPVASEPARFDGAASDRVEANSARNTVSERFASASWWLRSHGYVASSAMLCIWCAGTVAWFVFQLLLAMRFRRVMSTAREPSPELQMQVGRLAQQMGLSRWPRLRLADCAFSPMLWGLGNRAVIVLPPQLIAGLCQQRCATLLLHELAHYRRGDQWIRLLELLVTGLFWWHPVVWWARREIEVAEEQCCDGWVVQQCAGKGRCYAEALLDAVDFLSTARTGWVPAGASGIGRAPQLRKRLITIMKGGLPKGLSPHGRLLFIAVAAAGLPVHPTLSNAQPRITSAATISSLAEPRIKNRLAARASYTVTPETSRALTEPEDAHHAGLAPSSPPDTAPIWASAYSRNGRHEITVRRGFHAVLRDVVSNRTIDLGPQQIICVAFLPDSSRFAAGGFDGSLGLWDSAMGRAIETVRQTDAAIHSVAFSCDGRWLAAGGREGVVRLYEVGSGLRNPHTIANESGPVRSVGFSRDGRYLAIVTDTWLSAGLGQVAIWDVRTTTHVATLTFSAPMAVAEFAADNSLLVVDWTGNVTRRSIFGGETLMRTTISKDLVSAASFSADTRALEGAMEVLCPGSG